MMDRIIAYAHGSVIDERGGWAVKMTYKGHVVIKGGGKRGYTANQMQMYAVFKAMQCIANKKIPVTMYSDSQYVIKTFNGEFKSDLNETMWHQLKSEASKFAEIEFTWSKSDDANADIDEIAFQEAQKC